MNKKNLVIIFIIIFIICIIISSTLEYSLNKKVKKPSSVDNDKTTTKIVTTLKKENIMEGISLNYHASIKINKNNKILYFDPYKINESLNDADYIFITHSHYDHFSLDDIKKVMNDNTKFIVTSDVEVQINNLGISSEKITVVYPNETYTVDDISFDTVPSYNINKTFHKKSYNWVGYNVNINNTRYYIVGDSDVTDELKDVKCDVIFIPVGGTYTMTASEAADAVNTMDVKYAIPIHYGETGSRTDAENFVNNLDSNIKGEILK